MDERTRDISVTELHAAVAKINAEIRSRDRLSAQSEPRVFGLLERFTVFAGRALGVTALADVSCAHVEAFVRSSTVGSGKAPSAATMQLRRSTLRLLFRTARELGLLDADPTVDLVLPSRTRESARPFTDGEVEQCRRVCLHDLRSTRLSVAWALGEATARTGEIPHISLSDLDLERTRVWIHGSSRTEARWGVLTEWGASQVARHLRGLSPDVERGTLLAYGGSGSLESRRSFSSQAIRETLQRAGLTADPHVRPASLAAWAGVCVMRETGLLHWRRLRRGVRVAG